MPRTRAARPRTARTGPRRARPARTALAVTLLTVTGAVTAACGDTGGLRGAGATPTATSPAKLWPHLAPATSPAWNYDDGESELVRGITAPGDDIRKVDPVAVVREEISRHPDDYTSPKAPYAGTARRLADCAEGAGHGSCPVLKPYYRDLTGDGRADLTLGFRLLPGNQTAVRVYTFESGRLVQVMSNDDAVSGVELAGRSVIIHSPSDIADYEYRFQWTWDPDQRVMLLTHDEMLRTGGGKGGKRDRRVRPSATAAPSTSPAASPSTSPSASPTASVGA